MFEVVPIPDQLTCTPTTIGEKALAALFLKHSSALGFTELEAVDNNLKDIELHPNRLGPGDFLGRMNDTTVRIEIEVNYSTFFVHKKRVRDKIGVIAAVWDRTDPPKLRSPDRILELEKKRVILLVPQWVDRAKGRLGE